MVVAWNPSSAIFSESMKETLEKAPEGRKSSSSVNQPVDAEDLEGGSSAGDDENDF